MTKFTLVTNSGKKYSLNDNEEIHRGGEGRILAISTEPNLVAKIYHDGIVPITEEQFNYLSKLDKNLFVVPQELLYNKQNLIAGFTMEYIGHEYYPLSAIFGKSFCLQNNISEQIKRIIAENLIKALEYAHEQNLIIGDLNQYNVLINNSGNVKLIDVDSYETPNHKHSGMLLEDIRDYLYGGKITKNSDFFALSVLLFYSLTYTHPFKGIHKKYKTLAERMFLKIPVFLNDPDLIKPKCYEPVTDDMLHNQFSKFYINGERFLLSLSGVGAVISQKLKPVIIDKIIQKELIITPILQNTNINDIVFNTEIGYIETDELFIIYNAKNKGYLSEKYKISKNEFSKIYLSTNHVLARKKNKLYHYISPTEQVEITNYQFPAESISYQTGNILIVIDNDVMTWLYLNEILHHSIQNKRIEVFGRGFKLYNGLIQNSGGVNRLFYDSGKDIATVKLPLQSIKELYQQANTGIIQYVEQNQIKNQYFKISGLNIEFANSDIQRVFNYAYMQTSANDGFIFEPSDNKIKILRSQDFQQTSELECDYVTELSKLQWSKAGIVAWEGLCVYLLNKKS